MGKYSRKKKAAPGKNSGLSVIVTTITLVLLTVLIGGVIFGIISYRSFLSKIPRAEYVEYTMSQEEISAMLSGSSVAADNGKEPQTKETVSAEVPPEPFDDVLNVLLIGQSAREGEEYHNADTVILVSINKLTKTMTLTSFLRDAYLKFPDYKDLSGRDQSFGMQRLNVCYHLGHALGGTAAAMDMLNQCLCENFGVDVDFDIEIGFEGVEKIVDYFGGIEVELTQEEADYLNADDLYVLYDVAPGPQLLNGMAALSYARMRNAEGDNRSDIRRTARQRVVLEKLLEKISGLGVSELVWLMEDFLPYVVTNMTNNDITRCILEIFPLVPELKLETGTCPAEGTYWGEIVNIGGFDSIVLQFDMDANREQMRLLTEGK